MRNRKLRNRWLLMLILLLVMLMAAAALLVYIKAGRNIHVVINYAEQKISTMINQKEVKFKDDNLYEDGIDGILKDVEKKADLPETAYLSQSFTLSFNEKGQITEFNFGLYGRTKKGDNEGFRIWYKYSDSDRIRILKNSYQGENFDDTAKLSVLQNTVNAVFKGKKPTAYWGLDSKAVYELKYFNQKALGNDLSSAQYIDKKGQTKAVTSQLEAENVNALTFTFDGADTQSSLQKQYTETKYIYTADLNHIEIEDPDSEAAQKAGSEQTMKAEQDGENALFYLNDKTGYMLKVTDAAAGSRYYELDKTTDGSSTWTVVNQDPFHGNLGSGATMQFADENTAVLYLGHSGGEYYEAYFTADGGKTVSQPDFAIPKISVSGGSPIEAFDKPGEFTLSGTQYLLSVTQENIGYSQGGKALTVVSGDQGKTWTVRQ